MAERLAARLANHASCDTHSARAPDPNCPFCEDRSAYAEYIAAGGRDHSPLADDGRVYSFEEWKALAEAYASTSVNHIAHRPVTLREDTPDA